MQRIGKIENIALEDFSQIYRLYDKIMLIDENIVWAANGWIHWVDSLERFVF